MPHLALPVAVCSGSYAVVIEAALRRLGIESDVAVWHSAEWEPLGKPHPGSYLSTASKLGIDPTSCLAVEDSFNGAISAKAARMRVVVVPEPEAADSPRWGFCDAKLPSLIAFDEGLLRSLEGPVGLTVAGGQPANFRFGNVRSVPIHEARGAFPGQGRPSDVGPIPEAGRSGHVALVLMPGKSRTRPETGARSRRPPSRRVVPVSGLRSPGGGAGSVRP